MGERPRFNYGICREFLEDVHDRVFRKRPKAIRSGDLLSADRRGAPKALKLGLLAGGFFEYWRMYPDLKATVEHRQPDRPGPARQGP